VRAVREGEEFSAELVEPSRVAPRLRKLHNDCLARSVANRFSARPPGSTFRSAETGAKAAAETAFGSPETPIRRSTAV
jgi:hypothetical protein